MSTTKSGRPTDCIFCGRETGSREHTFPAALGGRRVNKGILCGSCNGEFSPLDAALAAQLGGLNGLLGVRGDHHDEPRHAVGSGPAGEVAIDGTGKPSLVEPVVIRDDPLPDGRRSVTAEFATEEAMQEWLAKERAAGRTVKIEERSVGQRFLEHVEMQWTFGGHDALREIGRIALNFLAHRWPIIARSRHLAPFKSFVKESLGGGESQEPAPPRVWAAPAEMFALPESPFPFGHQILLRVGEDGSYARVRFFSTLDYVVALGALQGVAAEAVIVDIDPLAEHPPDDVRFTVLPTPSIPSNIESPARHPNVVELVNARMHDLMRRVLNHQRAKASAGLADALNAARAKVPDGLVEAVVALLEPHRGRVLGLARHAAGHFRARAKSDPVSQLISHRFEGLVATDTDSRDGLTDTSRDLLEKATLAVATAISTELATGPIDDARLQQFLDGGEGVALVTTEMLATICGPKFAAELLAQAKKTAR